MAVSGRERAGSAAPICAMGTRVSRAILGLPICRFWRARSIRTRREPRDVGTTIKRSADAAIPMHAANPYSPARSATKLGDPTDLVDCAVIMIEVR